jgi:hypothetical protein
MMRMKLVPLLLILWVVAFPGSGNALLYDYDVAGKMFAWFQPGVRTDVTVRGSMTIDGTAEWGSAATFGEGFDYRIDSFSLEMDSGQSFAGSGEIRFMDHQYGPGEDFLGESWVLNGSGDWSWWFGESPMFFNRDGSPFLPLTTLAPVITLGDINPHMGSVIGIADIGMSRPDWEYPEYCLTLTRSDDPAPVPEPGTIALVGAGLVGLLGLKRRRTA